MDDSRSTTPHVVVIGGGMAGVCAARHLVAGGVRVSLLESSDALGGCVRTVPFAGTRVDVGAEAMHTAAPEPNQLVEALGLAGAVVASAGAATLIGTPTGRLRPLPAGVGPAGPSRVRPLVTAGLLGPTGLLRAAMEPLLPRTRPLADRSVGEVLTHRFGRQVVDRIVDPLLGGLHAGAVHRLALDAASPQLASLLAEHRSIVLAMRRRRGSAAHGFVTLRGGLGRLFDTAGSQLGDAAHLGVAAHTVVDTGAGPGRYRVETSGPSFMADGVVVATPAHVAAPVLAPFGVAASLAEVRAASVAIVLLAYPATLATRAVLDSTGLLLGPRSGRLLRAATFLTTKWPHLDTPHVLVRASVGRSDDNRCDQLSDDELVGWLARDLAEVAGLDVAPVTHRVVRWPDAMPQLEVGHSRHIDAARAGLAAHPRVALAGASYDGVGLGPAARSGLTAARQVLAHLDQPVGAPA